MKQVHIISVEEAAKMVKDGDTLLQGGFGMMGNPVHLMHALAKTLIHTDPDGTSKVVPKCTLPLTAIGVVALVITDLAVFNYEKGKLTLIELMSNVTLEEVRAKTKATFVEKLIKY